MGVEGTCDPTRREFAAGNWDIKAMNEVLDLGLTSIAPTHRLKLSDFGRVCRPRGCRGMVVGTWCKQRSKKDNIERTALDWAIKGIVMDAIA